MCNPIRTRTAAQCDEWLPIRPGSDGGFDVTGEMTIKGKSKTVTVPITVPSGTTLGRGLLVAPLSQFAGADLDRRTPA